MDIFNTLNQSNYIFYFLVVDNTLDIILPQLTNFHLIYAFKNPHLDTLKQQNLPYFCLEETGVNLEIANSGKLLSQPLVIDYINQSSANKQVVIIPFKPSARIDFLCHQNNWICASNNHQLNRKLEDKIIFQQLCQKNNLPQIPSSIDNFNQNNFLAYQKKYQPNLVIQSHFGWAGKSTFSSNNWAEIKNKIPINTVVKFSPFINGYSLLNNCCLTSKGLIQSPPALQYTGIKPFTQHPFTTVGRQWPSLAPKNIIDKVNHITQDFSAILNQVNYKGFFGLDFMVDNDNVYLLECNPRLTASFAFYNQIETKLQILPLFLLHLIQFLNIDLNFNIVAEQKRVFNQQIIGSEITAKNKSGKTINKYHDFFAFSQQLNPIIFAPEIISHLNGQE